MAAKRVVNIGQEAFVLSQDGEVVRTMVAKLEKNGYRFLNGDDDHRIHWFTFEGAVAAASDRVNTRQKALRKELRALGRKRRALETQEYRDGVMNAPYRVVDLRDEMILAYARPRRPRILKKIWVPETYLTPGHVVYVIITPMTQSSWAGAYRPHKHFVLETEVKSVCFSPDGQAHYMFSTLFIVEEFFLSREEATARLQSYSEPGTKDPVPFVSSKQEKEENERLLGDNIPF
ncbi:MAG: hypothetical protein WC217_01385 [Candidatus Paceibacterota bacterium]|jgi:hypothetical protein